MLLMTSERCPECDSIAYIRIHPKFNDEGNMIVRRDADHGGGGPPHVVGDGCYLDRDGILCITRFDDNTRMPDYCCLFCGWVA